MTLRLRLLLGALALTLVTIAALGFGVREAWRKSETERFDTQFSSTARVLAETLASEAGHIEAVLGSLCDHDELVDSALVDLRAGGLSHERRLTLQLRLPERMKALRLDELILFQKGGEILGAGSGPATAGVTRAELAARLKGSRSAQLNGNREPARLEASCVKSDGPARLGLYGAWNVDVLFSRMAAGSGLRLSLAAPPKRHLSQMMETLGATVYASRSRTPLASTLSQLDLSILAIAAVALLIALVLAAILSQRLARPIVELSRQAERIVDGDPQPVQVSGPRELKQFAESFNHAILDLTELRKRLAVTERIAARREIARQVAHEIKNPLSPIRAAVETLRRLRARGDDAFADYFEEASATVLSEVARITRTVQEFTEFARLPAPQMTEIDMVSVARQVTSLHDGDDASVTLLGAKALMLRADRDQMVQLLTNLVQNGLDAARAHSSSPAVTVSVDEADHQRVSLMVRDNGPGVPDSLKDRVFEPYVSGKSHGTGLGLAIVQRIVCEHGGNVVLESPDADSAQPGLSGAAFRILLPISGPTLLPTAPEEDPTSTVE